MTQHAADGRFAHQELYEFFFFGVLGQDDLQRHFLAKAPWTVLLGEADLGHGPGAKGAEDPVWTYRLGAAGIAGGVTHQKGLESIMEDLADRLL